MRARNQFLLGLTLMLVLLLFAYQSPLASDFVFGGFTDYTPMELLNKDWYDTAGLNAIAIAVDTPGTPSTGLDSLAARNWKVMATIERQSDTAHNRSWPLYACLHSHLIHWQAEDTGSVPLYNSGVTTCVCAQGELSGQYWHIVPGVHPVTPGVADWQLREHYQQKQLDYTAIFYMKIDSIGNEGDTVARISVVDTIPETQSRTVIVDSMFRAGDFQGNGVLSPITITYTFGDTTGPWNSNIAVDWWGTRELWLDSIVMFNQQGSELVRDSSSVLRDSVRQQALRYASTFLPDTNLPALQWWHGEENFYSYDGIQHGYPYVDNLEAAAYLDSLLSRDYGQGFMCDRNLTEPLAYVGFDSMYLSRAWPQHRNYMMWCYSFTHPVDSVLFVSEPDSANLLEVQARFDTVTQALEYSRSLTERFNADLHYVAQAFAQTPARQGDPLRPTASELKCLSFLGLAFGVDGLWYWPYDSGGDLYPGLVLASGRGPKYYTVKNYVRPIVSRCAETLQGLQRRGTGRLDTLLSANWNPVSGVVSQPMTDPYVEAGVFEDASSVANYLVLVNRNTSTSTWRRMTLTVESARLLAPGRTHYYLIDLNPADTGTAPDTVLAGPISGLIKYNAEISPGGIKLLKIVPAPDRIAGTTFPGKWWGAIHATEDLTLASSRSLNIAPGSQVSIHTECGYDIENPAKFYVNGFLMAVGTGDSGIVFDRVYDGPPQGDSCTGGDSTRWGGLDFDSGPTACSLAYCQILNAAVAVASDSVPPILDNVTTSNSLLASCDVTGASGYFMRMTNCNFDEMAKISGVTAELIGVSINNANNGVWVRSDAYCSMQDVSVQSFTGTGFRFEEGAHGTLHDISIYYGGTGIILDGADASMDSVTIGSVDTALYCDPGAGEVVTASFLRTASSNKGIVVRSGELRLDSCTVVSTALSAIDAFTGTALVRMDSCYVRAPSEAADVSIGTGARLVAKKCTVDSGWIGFEIYGKLKDSIMFCRILNNELYGVRFDTSDVADYTYCNLIVNSAASALNMGYYVNRQSIVSTNDTLKGGYAWNFNFFPYSKPNLRLTAYGTHITAKPGDLWGLVLNGIGSDYDSAFVTAVTVDSIFDGAHLYTRAIYAEIENCEFRSTLDPLTSSSYGIKDMGSTTTGHVRCTKSLNMGVDCVYRASSSSVSYGDAGSSSTYGNNSFYVTDTIALPYTKYFHNLGSTTVKAEKNWWGRTSPSPARFAGPVDYTPTLTRAPICNEEVAKLAVVTESRPTGYSLGQNCPNPFNPSTTIVFELQAQQDVRMEIFNTLGQRVKAFDLGKQPAGQHQITWDGRSQQGQSMGSGVYFYRISMPDFVATKSMVLLK